MIKTLEEYPSYCKLAAVIYYDISCEINIAINNLQATQLPITSTDPNALESIIKHRSKLAAFQELEIVFSNRAFVLDAKGDNP